MKWNLTPQDFMVFFLPPFFLFFISPCFSSLPVPSFFLPHFCLLLSAPSSPLLCNFYFSISFFLLDLFYTSVQEEIQLILAETTCHTHTVCVNDDSFHTLCAVLPWSTFCDHLWAYITPFSLRHRLKKLKQLPFVHFLSSLLLESRTGIIFISLSKFPEKSLYVKYVLCFLDTVLSQLNTQ